MMNVNEETIVYFSYNQLQNYNNFLQPENILLASEDEKTCIKLTDFGLSKIAVDSSQMMTFCGTLTYIPPELLTGEAYTNKVDMWSLGVVLFVR